jgi:molecular chaperone GrpE (heat shock protein)
MSAILAGVTNSLREQAKKAATEELKKVAAKMQEHRKGIRLATEKLQKEVTEHEKAIAALNEDAAQVQADFEADWGPWNNGKPEAVKTEDN